MTSKERVLAALQHREADRVPVGEAYVDYPVIEHVIGRQTFYRSHARETLALWDGLRDEVVDGQKRDLVEFVRRTGLDIAPVWPVPPRNRVVEKPRRLGPETWEDRAGHVLQLVPATEEIVVVRRGTRPVEPLPQPPPDGSEWELWDYVVQELGSTHFLIASAGPSLGIADYRPTDIDGRFGRFEVWMLRLATDPEGVAAEEIRRLDGFAEAARALAGRGIDAVRTSPDYGYGRATYCSPDLFRRAFLPGLRRICAQVHAAGLVLHFHCDANMSELADVMPAAGVDIYQSIEPHEPIARYKQEIGDRVTLWGGVSCHDLCTAPAGEIRRQALYAIRHCAPGGGFILGSSHNLLIATRYENFMAMLDTAFTAGRYPIA
ncbi:MAG: uroporphyrinogen decarboxylase family protein [Candidatus Latescibacterota bacterium]